MAGRRGNFRARGLTTRRLTGWDIGPDSSSGTVSITSGTKTIIGTVVSFLVDGLTIVRIRGTFSYYIRIAQTVFDGFDNAVVGMCLVTDDARIAGSASVPGPVTDDEWDGWMFHKWLPAIISPATANIDPSGGGFLHELEIDTKAMRKVTDNESLIFVFEGTEIGAVTMEVDMNTRILVKLP